jgi:hypothetical protein
MTTCAAGRPFFIQIMACDTVLVCPAFTKVIYLSDLLHMTYCTNADPIRLVLDVIKLHTFPEYHDITGERAR